MRGTSDQVGAKVDRLRVRLARVRVGPYLAMREGEVVPVAGYLRDYLHRLPTASEDNPDWDTPGHDYDPSWDYEVDEDPAPEVVAAAEAARPGLEQAARSLGMGKPQIAYIHDSGSDVAVYAWGTAPHPVLMVDGQAHMKGVDPQDLKEAIQDSLFHEWAHGVQDWLGIEADEDQAEGFARAVSEYGNPAQRAVELEAGIRRRM